jgi:hypothetical protein
MATGEPVGGGESGTATGLGRGDGVGSALGLGLGPGRAIGDGFVTCDGLGELEVAFAIGAADEQAETRTRTAYRPSTALFMPIETRWPGFA